MTHRDWVRAIEAFVCMAGVAVFAAAVIYALASVVDALLPE